MTTFLKLSALLLSLALLAGCDSAEEKAQSYYDRAMVTMAAGDLEKAALDFRNALNHDENHTGARLGLARIEEQRRNFDAAAALYIAIVRRDAQNVEARVKLAQLMLASQQVDSAATYADQAYRLSPTDPRVLAAKAGIALSRGNQADAVRLASQAQRIDPARTTALMVLAAERVAAADQPGALALIEQGLLKHRSNAGLQLLKLRTLLDMGDEQPIRQQFATLAQIFPNDRDIQDTEIKWYLDKGRNAEAEHAMRSFARANPGDDAAQIRLAMLISRMRGPAAAVAEMREITVKFPASDEARRVALMTAQAELEHAAGQPDAAVVTLQNLVATTKDGKIHVKAQARLAQLLLKMNKLQQAWGLSEAVLAADAQNVEALMVCAVARMASGNNAGAVEDLNVALAAAPGSAEVMLLLAQGYERIGSATLAEKRYMKALALSGYAPQSGIKLAEFLIRYGRAGRARQLLEDLRLRGTADRAALTLLARLKLDARDWQSAQDIAAELRKTSASGEDAAADWILAAALNGMDRRNEGIDLLLSRLRQSPDLQLESELVRTYLRTGKLAEAEALLRGRLAKAPADAGLHILLGSVMMTAGRTAETEAAFKTAVAHGDGDAALARFYMITRRPAEAEAAARAGLRRSPESVPLGLLLAEALETRGAAGEAIAEYERLLLADPTSTVAANNLASLLSERADDPKALQRAYDIAVRFNDADVPQFLDTLGWIHYLRGDHHAALPLLKRAAERLPNFGAVQFHLGMVLKENGQSALSARTLKRAVELAPAPDAAYVKTAEAALQQIMPEQTTN